MAAVQSVDAWMVNTALFTILSYWGDWRKKGGVRSEVHKIVRGVKPDRST